MITSKIRGEINLSISSPNTGLVGHLWLRSLAFEETRSVFQAPHALSWRSMPRHVRSNMGIIKKWLRECHERHGGCNSFQYTTTRNTEGPSRILDLANNKIRVMCDREANQPFSVLRHQPHVGLKSCLARKTFKNNLHQIPRKYVTDRLTVHM